MGYRELPLLEDYWLFARMIASGARTANLAEALVLYRIGAGSYERRGGLRLLRSELALQRRLRSRGVHRRRASSCATSRSAAATGWSRSSCAGGPTGARSPRRPLRRSRCTASADRPCPPPARQRDRRVRADVVVVGAGLFGLTVAERCASAGLDVLLV